MSQQTAAFCHQLSGNQSSFLLINYTGRKHKKGVAAGAAAPARTSSPRRQSFNFSGIHGM